MFRERSWKSGKGAANRGIPKGQGRKLREEDLAPQLPYLTRVDADLDRRLWLGENYLRRLHFEGKLAGSAIVGLHQIAIDLERQQGFSRRHR
jgi:hypothetical protein